MNVVVLIPAYNPDEKLVKLVNELSKQGFHAIVIVNDASRNDCAPVFDAVSKFDKTTILEHAVNKGQGGSLKTGLEYILLHFKGIVGTIHCDADGQHAVEDIIRTAQQLEVNPDTLVLGVRHFDSDVPLRSKFGNIMTSVIMNLLFKLKVSDTQTGMRGVPIALIPYLIRISYDRFEYNTEMLLVSRRADFKIMEIPIKTIYIDKNASSHFNPLIDSVKIYFALFRYFFVSLITAIVDYSAFILVFSLIENILYANFFARLNALAVQYFLVRKMVFFSQEKIRKTFPKYLLLVIVSGFISTAIINYLNTVLSINVIIAKIIAELLLYLTNFIIQRELIFIDKKES